MAKRLFQVVIDNGQDFDRAYKLENNERSLKANKPDNAHYLRITDVTDAYRVDVPYLEQVLLAAGYGDVERGVIVDCVCSGYAGAEMSADPAPIGAQQDEQ